ncbi:MAG: tRNA (adenosine(37)-N6)-threonylcarbamoyltransferase complex ATPase subunit type 1 TsaE [Alphaproteobacteria bacterium]|nr:tRNA (adenosine(37)-N6)-threonylcarbamoyltransferase complex ATPase subunit type 1 TsaE [Alphaproteobacteria bacterium]MBN2780325.1 tRNA (adenosine(37)-N6)-threonylcarbamoyltransferase complex ATPase subunit type 1 TsaE [Alphaproteobacteria bacterium]
MAGEITAPAIFALNGDLGAGKTTFVRGFIQALCGNIAVPSPTFTLMQEYETPKGTLLHVDLYRIHDLSEIQELGLEEYFDKAIIFIEWPDRMDLPKNTIQFEFHRTSEGLQITRN